MPELRRLSIGLPRPFWLSVVAMAVIALLIGFRIWHPYHSQQVAIRNLAGLGVRPWIRPGGPEWLREKIGESRMHYFDQVYALDFNSFDVNDRELAAIPALT